MDKKTGIVILVIGVVIVALVALAFGLELGTNQLTSEDILRINNEVYKKAEFEDFIKYKLYENNGELKIDEEGHAEDIANGATKEDLFVSDTLNSFYQMKVYSLLAEKESIELDEATLEKISGDFKSNEEKIIKAGLTKEEFIEFEKQQAIIDEITSKPNEYIELPNEVYDEYIKTFSGDDLKSYTYRMMQVAYTEDTVSGDGSGDVSGEIIPGNKAEKESYMNQIVARINSGESFEKAAESGDNRLIMKGNGLEFAKSMQEFSAGFLLEQKVGSEELATALKKTTAGQLTEVIDTGSVLQLALLEKVEDGIVGESEKELKELMLSQYASDLVYQIVKDMEVNNSAVSRIKIK